MNTFQNIKAKRYHIDEWVNGEAVFRKISGNEIIHCIAKGPVSITDGALDNCCRIKEDTICRSTGLTIDGREAYENDIYRDDYGESIYRITWDDRTASYVFADYGFTGQMMEYGWDEVGGEFDIIETLSVDDFYDLSHMTYVGNLYDFESMEAAYQKAMEQISIQEETERQ